MEWSFEVLGKVSDHLLHLVKSGLQNLLKNQHFSEATMLIVRIRATSQCEENHYHMFENIGDILQIASLHSLVLLQNISELLGSRKGNWIWHYFHYGI